ncbi:MAG: DMT family transporter [Ilumatobacteraceae bacterium]
MTASGRAAAVAPWLFVVLWSTGFIVARYGTDDADPLAFISVRLAAAAVVLGAVAVATRAPRPDRSSIGWSMLAGFGLHALYLGGVFVAVGRGMPSGVSALLAGLHPVVTTVAARALLSERVSRRQWVGIGLGVGGVGVVVVDRLGAGVSGGVDAVTLTASAVSIAGMCAGTLVQRRHGASAPLLWSTVWQYASSAAVVGLAAAVTGWRFEVTTRSLLALAWAVVVLSIAAVLIMLWLLQRHAAVRVSSLFFLTPALSAFEGAVLFGERLPLAAVVGLAVALVGVALAVRPTT